jgi:hypothetical protein
VSEWNQLGSPLDIKLGELMNCVCLPFARLESKKGPSTRLLLMTTGVLLRRLQEDLGDVSHLFIDEVQ